MYLRHARRNPIALLALLSVVSVVSAGCGTAAAKLRAVESPIDIDTSSVLADPDQPTLTVLYPWGATSRMLMQYQAKEPCRSRHKEEDVRGIPAPGFFVKYGDEKYELKNVHYHAPSEHKIDKTSAEVEAHLVHQNAKGDYLVLAVHLDTSATAQSGEHDKLIDSAPPVEICPPDPPMLPVRNNIALRGLLPADVSAYRYVGSLTTKREGEYHSPVQWLIMKQRMSLTTASQAKLHAIWPGAAFPHGNSKPVTKAAPKVYVK
ncbi:carbonic anhydrase [Sinosporangium album]|uniref:carbonic anhydrase n=1 Tax=Sinosporangium album TaxID=504805 RepID=A0A1G7TH32_9ACTN|nr:carbonic anhydrase family protein [Sinosporangium album]SDG34667.1 carbonic anhydrase [Sinosporangium album]